MKIKALGEMIVIQVDPPEDPRAQRADGVHGSYNRQSCVTPASTGIVVSLGDGYAMDRTELSVEERYRAQFRFPKLRLGDRVVFTRHAVPTQTTELVDEGVEYIVIPGISILGTVEEE